MVIQIPTAFWFPALPCPALPTKWKMSLYPSHFVARLCWAPQLLLFANITTQDCCGFEPHVSRAVHSPVSTSIAFLRMPKTWSCWVKVALSLQGLFFLTVDLTPCSAWRWRQGHFIAPFLLTFISAGEERRETAGGNVTVCLKVVFLRDLCVLLHF